MGRAAGGQLSAGPGAQAMRYSRLDDYRMEHIMLGGSHAAAASGKAPATGLPRWKQQVQYAVGHTLNDYYSLQPEVRRQTPIQFLLERRWPPQGNAVPSLMKYWEVKTAVTDELTRIVSGNYTQETPFMLYEQWHVPVPELDIELAMIFQLVWNSAVDGRCLNIQKFMINGHEEVITGFVHMCNVFCHQAYGRPAESIEIFSLLDGRRHRFDGAALPLGESLDYVRLLGVFLQNKETAELTACCGSSTGSHSAMCGGHGLM